MICEVCEHEEGTMNLVILNREADIEISLRVCSWECVEIRHAAAQLEDAIDV